jgi:hypothetical protein
MSLRLSLIALSREYSQKLSMAVPVVQCNDSVVYELSRLHIVNTCVRPNAKTIL